MNPSFIRKHPALTGIALFLFFFTMIIFNQPRFLYNHDGSLRCFGIGYKNKTIFPIWLLSIVLGILCYTFVVYYLHFPHITDSFLSFE